MAEENEGTSRAPYAGDGEGLTKRQKRLLKMTNTEPMSRSRACRGRNSGRGRGKATPGRGSNMGRGDSNTRAISAELGGSSDTVHERGHGCSSSAGLYTPHLSRDIPFARQPPPQDIELDDVLDDLLVNGLTDGICDPAKEVADAEKEIAEETEAAGVGSSTSVATAKKKSRGAAKLKNPPPERQILLHGQRHIYRGKTRTLMTCIFKTYHTREALNWKQWKQRDKDECWRKFMINWPKWLQYARSAASKDDPDFASNPQSKPPEGHKWLAPCEWRVFCNFWNSPAWKRKSEQAKRNRNKESVKLIPLSGKTPLEERLDAEEDQDQPPMLRALEIGHKSRNGTWSSETASNMHASYQNALERQADEVEESTGVRPPLRELDPKLEIYLALPGASNHGRVTCMSRVHYSESSHFIGEVFDTSERLLNMEEQLRKSGEANVALQKQMEEMVKKHKEEMDERVRKHQEEIEELKRGQDVIVSQMSTLTQRITQHFRLP